MSQAALLREWTIVRMRLTYDFQPHWWWLERLERIEAEVRRRG
jgi:hypothetical protein